MINLKNKTIVCLGLEIKQPTIVDPIAFDQWRTEAFGLWTAQWASLYEPESKSRKNIYNIINIIHDDVDLFSIDFILRVF